MSKTYCSKKGFNPPTRTNTASGPVTEKSAVIPVDPDALSQKTQRGEDVHLLVCNCRNAIARPCLDKNSTYHPTPPAFHSC